jgi:hypothetical protein
MESSSATRPTHPFLKPPALVNRAPANRELDPSSSSIRMSWLYFRTFSCQPLGRAHFHQPSSRGPGGSVRLRSLTVSASGIGFQVILDWRSQG